MSIEAGDLVIDERRLGGARARLTFAVLVLERPRPVDRHQLAEVLWPDGLPASWEAALRVVISRTRAFLAAAGLPASELLTNSYGCYRLTLPDDVVVDVEAAAAAVERAEIAGAAGEHERAVAAAGEARTITARAFIPGTDGEWVDAARRRQSGLRVRALDVLARSSIQLGESALAIEAAQELLGLDPYRDASHVLVMEAHRAAGNRAEALRAYGWCRHVLAEELGVDPSPETEALYRSLLREVHGGEPARDVVWSTSSSDLPPNNLPAQLSTFVGRERELREIRKLLEGERLVTLTGPAGSGKTRLALEVAGRSLAAHADGSWFVDLAPLSDEALVPRTVAAAIGVVEQPPRDLIDTIVDHLRQREAILLVDNCEHVLGASASLIDALLRACPLLWVLSTSREPLGVPGEVLWRVPSLSTPEAGAFGPEASSSMEALLEYEAARLFVDRSRALVADKEYLDADAPAVAQICVRLDGIPLALELAAACTTALSVQQIAVRLDDRFRLLTLGSRTGQGRHQTLQRAVEWSHDLLTVRQQVLLRRLSVLAGGFTLEAAEEIGAGDDLHRDDVLDLLIGLVNKSLVVSQTSGGRARYRFLETIRHFALDRLVESGEDKFVRDAHLAWCVSLLAQAEPELSGPDQKAWFERLDTEIDNLRGALGWACAQGHGDAVLPLAALRLAGSLTLYWHVRGYYPEGRRWAEAALALAPDAPPLLRAKALWGVGFMAFYLGDVAATVPAIEECLALARSEGAIRETARALSMMGELASLQDSDTAHRVLGESAALAREAGDLWCLSYSLASRAWTEFYKGPSAVGRPLIEESMEVARRANDTRNLLRGSVCMAWGALLEGDFASGGDAERSLALGLTLARQLGDLGWTGLMLNAQGELAWRRGDYEAAGRVLQESAEIGRRLGSPYALAPPYGLLGRRAKAMGELDEAATWFEEALDISRQAGMHLFVPWWVWGRADVYRLAGDHPAALEWLAEARTVAETVGNDTVVAFTLWARGAIAQVESRLDEADTLHRDALRLRQTIGDGAGILDSLEALAGLAAARGDIARTARLLAAAGAQRSVTRCARAVPQQAEYDAAQALARTGLPAGAYERAWSEGLRLSRDEAVAVALGDGAPDGGEEAP
jgi:predicted ATPase/DNA-binding SARP family transcriptional activator